MITATLRGLTIGEDTDYPFVRGPGGFGVIARQNTVQLIGGGRAFTGADVGDPDSLTFEMYVLGDSPADTIDKLNALMAAWAPASDDVELTVDMVGAARVYRGRPERVVPVLDDVLENSVASAMATFTVTDPLWYADEWKSAFVTPAQPGTWTLPMTLPVTFGPSTGGPQDVSVTNSGTADAPWRVRLVGPLPQPVVSLNGKKVAVLGDIAAGSSALLDSRSQSIMVDGVYQPWLSISSEWWEIPPGTSTFSIRTQSGSTGSATLSWRDASR